MAYLISGLVALLIGLYAIRAFARANPGHVARRMTVSAGIVSLLAAALLFLRGLEAFALPLAMFGSYMLWGSTRGPWGASTRRRWAFIVNA